MANEEHLAILRQGVEVWNRWRSANWRVQPDLTEAQLRLVDMDTLRDWECFDADTGKDLAVEVREYFIPDFTHWKDHDSFERAFARFLKDLQAIEAPPVPRTVEAPIVSGDAKAGVSESIIEIKKRWLRLLEEQQARKGHDTEPHIAMEIEDLRRELGELEA